MAKSNTKINDQLRRKRNPEVVDTIITARKIVAWKRVSEILSSPRKNKREMNLNRINEDAKEGETIIIPGKVLSMGELNKKVKIAALKFSHGAEEKILKAGGKTLTILEEIKKNPEAKGIKILE